jgi:sigma-B regulation protein RsbU (phosphoserine phosphatase)
MTTPAVPSAESRYRLFLRLSQEISRTIELPEVLAHLLEAVRSVVAYDAAGIFVLNRSVPLADHPRGHLIGGVATVGFAQEPTLDDPMLLSGQGIVGHVIRTGETVVTPDVSRDPRYVVGRDTTRSEVAVPIVSNQQVVGALNLESDRLGAFSAGDAEMLESFAVAAALSIEKALLHQQLIEKQRIEQQLKIAGDVQAALLPASAPDVPGYDMAGVNLPTWDIGGDYFDYLPLDGGRVGLVIGDVSGKGVPAALIMATFRAALRGGVQRDDDLRRIMIGLNDLLGESIGTARFVTAVYAVLDPDTGRLTYVNCGHNPPVILRADGGREALERGGPALGMWGTADFEVAETRLDPGDILVLYTDGVVELTDATDDEYGLHRLERVVREHARLAAADIVDRVTAATRAFADREGYADDFTLVIAKRGAR